MRGRAWADQEGVIARLCAGLAQGRSLRAVCGAPGLPPFGTVMEWQRRDPALRERLHAARGPVWSPGRPDGREAAVRWLCDQLSRGWSLHRACREPQAPNYHTLMRWFRADPALKARVRQAQDWGVQFRPRFNQERYRYDYAVVDRFLARVAAGASVRRMQRAHEAPDRAVIRAWKHMRADFVERYAAAKGAGAAARKGRPVGRPFDQGLADRLLGRLNRGERLEDLVREPGMPGWADLARWRKADADFARVLPWMMQGGALNRRRARAIARRSLGGPGQALIRRIGCAIAAGDSVADLCARPWAPSRDTFYRWRRRYPAFAEEVAVARDHRDGLLRDEAEDLLEQGGPARAAQARRVLARVAWMQARSR